MNNNRNQSNRRRGRGNRNQGGGNQGNRIDSRARGNAPQLLDKYKKLAQDAQHNGDRVQAEYYLQFADHYFRVIADNRSRQDEQRGGRRDEREQDDFESEEESESEDRRRFEPRDRDSRDTRRDRPRRDFPRGGPLEEVAAMTEAVEGPAFEPEDNPFTRDAREPREDRPRRRTARARRDADEEAAIDAAALPPSFSANDIGEAAYEAEDAAPRPRRKRSGGGTLSAVG